MKPRYWLAGTLSAICVAIAANATVVNQVVNTIVATTCTNQFARAISATGAATCASVAIGSDVSGLGTGVATALGTNVGSAGAPVVLNGAGGTPSSLTLTNATGLPNAGLASMADSTIKGRAVGAGTGAPTDLTATQAAAIIGSVGGALKSKTIEITRDLTAATGSVAYTGMGFQPTACVANGNIASSLSQYTNIWSTSDSTRAASSVYLGNSLIGIADVFLVFMDATAANLQTALISTYDADGLTLSWTKTGSPTGTATIHVTCYR